MLLNHENSLLQEQLEQARRWPTLSPYEQAGTLSQNNSFQAAESRWPFVSYVGQQLSVPLFNPATSATVQQARITSEQA